MIMSPDWRGRGRVLVRLSDVTQELTVGIANASASVRTLTDVSLIVRERELVVLSGSRGAGERAVLAIVAGDRRGFSGTCEVHKDARIRIMRIGAQAALALAEEWQQVEVEPEFKQPELAKPDIFLLDVVADSERDHAAGVTVPPTTRVSGGSVREAAVREAAVREAAVRETRACAPRPWNEKNRAALRAWAQVCRMRGGAVIMAAGEQLGRGMFDSALVHVARRPVGVPGGTTAVREVALEESSVRVVVMHSGRMASAVRLRTLDLPVWHSKASHL